MSNIEEKVKAIIVEQLDLDVDPSELNNNASFVDDLGAEKSRPFSRPLTT